MTSRPDTGEAEWVTVFIYRGHEIKALGNAEAGDVVADADVMGYRIGRKPEIYTTAGDAVDAINRMEGSAR